MGVQQQLHTHTTHTHTTHSIESTYVQGWQWEWFCAL